MATTRSKKPEPNLIHPSDPNPSGTVRNRLPVVRQGLEIIDPKNTTEQELIDRFAAKRTPYAPMRAHMELSAQVLAVGGTFKMAAARAGTSTRQVKKYWMQEQFRNRVEELRMTLLSRLRGRIVRELERRTGDESIKEMELLDLLRVWDRVGGGVKGPGGITVGEMNLTQNNYDHILAAIITPDRGAQGSDFPSFEPGDLLLPGTSSPVE